MNGIMKTTERSKGTKQHILEQLLGIPQVTGKPPTTLVK
jgi:hypothetical protein